MYKFCALIFLLTSLIACSSGGGSSSGSNSSSSSASSGGKPEPALLLGGVVFGLSEGALVLDYGKGVERVNANELAVSPFLFTERFERGEEFDVSILSKPNDAVCEIRNGHGFVFGDLSNSIEVYCAKLQTARISVSLPNQISPSAVYLSSNFDSTSKASNVVLDVSGESLLVQKNSFVTLKLKSNDEVLLISYIDGTKASYALDPASTALGLALLEPTVSAAILNRYPNPALEYARIKQFANQGASETDSKSLDRLAGAIGLVLFAGASIDQLFSNSSLNESEQLLADSVMRELRFSVRNILRELEKVEFHVSFDQEPEETEQQLQLTQLENAYVSVRTDLIPGTQNGLSTIVRNNLGRSVVVGSDKFDDRILDAFEETVFDLESGLDEDDAIHFDFYGPGKPSSGMGGVAEFKLALAASGVNGHLMSSFNLMLGLQIPSEFKIKNCLSELAYTEFLEDLALGIANTSKFFEDEYDEAYLPLFASARSKFISKSYADETLIHALFQCDKFGAGYALIDGRALAERNVHGLIKLTNTVFKNFSWAENPYLNASLTHYTEAYNLASPSSEWSFANRLQLIVSADQTEITVGESVAFSAECVDPDLSGETEALDCEISWDFGNGFTSDLAQVSQEFNSVGVYNVKVSAFIPQGATDEQNIQIRVLDNVPKVFVTYDGLEVEDGVGRYDFGEVLLGEKKSLEFEIKNTGKADLYISEGGISLSDNLNFKVVSSGGELQEDGRIKILTGAGVYLAVSFEPVFEGSIESRVQIVTNQMSDNLFHINLAGVAVNPEIEEAEGSWLEQNASGDQIDRVVKRGSRQFLQTQAGTDNMQLRFFVEGSSNYPQLVLDLWEFPPVLRTGEELQFDLRDDLLGVCKGKVLLSPAPEDFFCTVTSSEFTTQEFTGSVTISVNASDSSKMDVQFEFDAVQTLFGCSVEMDQVDLSQCESKSFSGTVTIDRLDN